MSEPEETVVTNQEPTAENATPEVTPEAPETPVNEDPTLLGPETPEEGSSETPEGTEKPEEAEEPEEKVVPEKYDIKLDEGLELDTETLDLFTPIFKELGITNEGAQKLVDSYVPLIQSTIDKQLEKSQEDFKQIVTGWKKETMDNLGVTAKTDLAACGRWINKFGTPELRVMMQETGVGNHIELVKAMVKAGKSISEDPLVDPNTPAHELGGGTKLYPSMKQ